MKMGLDCSASWYPRESLGRHCDQSRDRCHWHWINIVIVVFSFAVVSHGRARRPYAPSPPPSWRTDTDAYAPSAIAAVPASLLALQRVGNNSKPKRLWGLTQHNTLPLSTRTSSQGWRTLDGRTKPRGISATERRRGQPTTARTPPLSQATRRPNEDLVDPGWRRGGYPDRLGGGTHWLARDAYVGTGKLAEFNRTPAWLG